MNRKAAVRIILYLFLLIIPIIIATAAKPTAKDTFLHTLGVTFALPAFAIFALQPVLGARIRWIERPFGLNLTFPFHRNMALLATLLVIAHPLLMVFGGSGWKLIVGADSAWFIWLGRITLLVLLLNVALTLMQSILGPSFESWRRLHDIAGPLILVMAFIHSWRVGIDLTLPAMQVLWAVFLVLGLGLFFYHRFWVPARLRRHPYRVVEVSREAHDVWTLKFAPPPGRARFDFLPGQFQFITLLRGRDLPEEEHHFTISSSPTQPDFHTSTIKAVGDFTATIGATRPGDLAVIQAPFGRFSAVLYPDAKNLVFIAGGIGITPLMSNLRYLHDTRSDHRILLLYLNKTEADIVFRDELAELEKIAKPELKVVHLLSRSDQKWPGEKGHLDQEALSRLAGDRLKNAMFFLCGPPTVMRKVWRYLRDLGVSEKRICVEYFSLTEIR